MEAFTASSAVGFYLHGGAVHGWGLHWIQCGPASVCGWQERGQQSCILAVCVPGTGEQVWSSGWTLQGVVSGVQSAVPSAPQHQRGAVRPREPRRLSLSLPSWEIFFFSFSN